MKELQKEVDLFKKLVTKVKLLGIVSEYLNEGKNGFLEKPLKTLKSRLFKVIKEGGKL